MIINQVSSGGGTRIIGSTETSATADSAIQKGEFIQVLNESRHESAGYWYTTNPKNYDNGHTCCAVRTDGKIVLLYCSANSLHLGLFEYDGTNLTQLVDQTFHITEGGVTYNCGGTNISSLIQLTDDVYLIVKNGWVSTDQHQYAFLANVTVNGLTQLTSSNYKSFTAGSSGYTSSNYDYRVIDSSHVLVCSGNAYDSEGSITNTTVRSIIYNIDLSTLTLTKGSTLNFTTSYTGAGNSYTSIIKTASNRYVIIYTPAINRSMYYYEVEVSSSFVLSQVYSGTYSLTGGTINRWLEIGNNEYYFYPGDSSNRGTIYCMKYENNTFTQEFSLDLSSYTTNTSYFVSQRTYSLGNRKVFLIWEDAGNALTKTFKALILNFTSSSINVLSEFGDILPYYSCERHPCRFIKTNYGYLYTAYCGQYVVDGTAYAHTVTSMEKFYYSNGVSPAALRIDGVATTNASVGDNVTFITDVNFTPGSVYSPATATASELLTGYTAWSNGELLEGTLPEPLQIYQGIVTAASNNLTITTTFEPKYIHVGWINSLSAAGASTATASNYTIYSYTYNGVNNIRQCCSKYTSATASYAYYTDLTTASNYIPTVTISSTGAAFTYKNYARFIGNYYVIAIG